MNFAIMNTELEQYSRSAILIGKFNSADPGNEY